MLHTILSNAGARALLSNFEGRILLICALTALPSLARAADSFARAISHTPYESRRLAELHDQTLSVSNPAFLPVEEKSRVSLSASVQQAVHRRTMARVFTFEKGGGSIHSRRRREAISMAQDNREGYILLGTGLIAPDPNLPDVQHVQIQYINPETDDGPYLEGTVQHFDESMLLAINAEIKIAEASGVDGPSSTLKLNGSTRKIKKVGPATQLHSIWVYPAREHEAYLMRYLVNTDAGILRHFGSSDLLRPVGDQLGLHGAVTEGNIAEIVHIALHTSALDIHPR